MSGFFRDLNRVMDALRRWFGVSAHPTSDMDLTTKGECMNYKAQLKGWCIDRVTELAKVNGSKPDLETIMRDADILTEYAYIPSKDLEDAANYLFDLVRNAPAGEAKIDALIGTLERIQNDRYGQRIDILPPPVLVNSQESH